MNKVVNKTETRKEMYYLLADMSELNVKVEEGKKAKRELQILEGRFRDLCRLEIKEVLEE